MTKNIIVIGQSITKTIIKLSLDDLNQDEVGRWWLDVCFDQSNLKIESVNQAVFDLTLFHKILKTLDFAVFNYSDNRTTDQVELLAGDQTKTLTLSHNSDYLWQIPEFEPDYILLMKSANLSTKALAQLEQILQDYPQTRLILEQNSSLENKLISRANLIFVDGENYTGKDCLAIATLHQSEQILAVIKQDNLYLARQGQVYNFNKIRSYKLKVLVWLAVIIRVSDYDLSLEQMMIMIDQTLEQIHQLITPNLDQIFKQLNSLDSGKLNLAAGKLNQQQLLTKRRQFLINRAVLDLSNVSQLLADSQFSQPKLVEVLLVNNLLRTHGLDKSLSSIILSEQQYKLFAKSNHQLIDNLMNSVLFGVRLDVEKQQLNGFGNETITEGLDNFSQRLAKYRDLGARFSNWQADFLISSISPSNPIVISNIHNIARFASLSQDQAILPVIKLNFITKLSSEFSLADALMKQQLIFKSLLTELKLLKVDLNNLIIEFNLLSNLGLKLNLDKANQQIIQILDLPTLKQAQTGLILSSDNLDWSQFAKFCQLAKTNRFNISLANRSIAELLSSWQYPEQNPEQDKLRIKFSQIIANL